MKQSLRTTIGVAIAFVACAWLGNASDGLAQERRAPRTVKTLWSDFDPRAEPLKTEVIRQWDEAGVRYRYVTFHVGRFKKADARVAAFYGFPLAKRSLPGLLHLHGGGQRASLNEVAFYAKRGYACLSINWGGREDGASQAGRRQYGLGSC